MHLNIKSYQLVFVVLLVCLLTSRCAIQVPPSGGPADVVPPVVKSTTPPNYSSQFKENKIRIYFNEYVEIKEASEQITISPIPEMDPDFSTKGKSIQVEFFEKLKDSTTYTINFGNSIKDYTVGNPLNNYQYVFSTGDYVDTSEIKGSVLDAFSLKPIEKCYVMIYDNNIDSLPLKEKPLYYAKTNKSGYFEIRNIRNGKYKIFALFDLNSNYIYDLPNETIAYIDTLVVSRIMDKPKPINDTMQIKKDSALIKKDSLAKLNKKVIKDPIKIKKDSIFKDSIRKDSLFTDSISKHNKYKLFLFQEKDTIQQLIKSSITENIKLTFIFKQGVKDLKIKPLNINYDTIWKLEEYNLTNDTIVYWLLKIKTDSLILQISDNGKILDTAEFKVGKTTKVLLGKGSPIPAKVSLKTNVGTEGFDYFKPLILSSTAPIIKYDLSKIKLTVKKDSIQDTLSFAIQFIDSLNKVLKIDYKWEEEKDYALFIPSGTLKDIHNNLNDTLIIPFKTRKYNDYGTMQLNVTLPDSSGRYNYIIQLLDNKEKVLAERSILQSKKVKYDFIEPGNYIVKIIRDSNGNGKWDTGNYMKNIQPEKVYYYPSPITIKAGWDIVDQEVNLNNY